MRGENGGNWVLLSKGRLEVGEDKSLLISLFDQVKTFLVIEANKQSWVVARRNSLVLVDHELLRGPVEVLVVLAVSLDEFDLSAILIGHLSSTLELLIDLVVVQDADLSVGHTSEGKRLLRLQFKLNVDTFFASLDRAVRGLVGLSHLNLAVLDNETLTWHTFKHKTALIAFALVLHVETFIVDVDVVAF